MIHFYFNNYNTELINYGNIVMAKHSVFIDYFNVSKKEKKFLFWGKSWNTVHSFSFGTKLRFWTLLFPEEINSEFEQALMLPRKE